MSDFHHNDIDRPETCAGCGNTHMDVIVCLCSRECRVMICDTTTTNPGCEHTVLCEQCHLPMLKSHAFDAGDHFLCRDHGKEYETRHSDPWGRPAGIV